MIHSTPEVMRVTVNLNENLVQVPLPIGMGAHLLDTFSADLGSEQRAKSITPKPNRFVTDIDPSLMQKVFDVSLGKREADVHHHRQANDVGAGFEVPKWRVYCHQAKLRSRPAPHKSVSSYTALLAGRTFVVIELKGRSRKNFIVLFDDRAGNRSMALR